MTMLLLLQMEPNFDDVWELVWNMWAAVLGWFVPMMSCFLPT